MFVNFEASVLCRFFKLFFLFSIILFFRIYLFAYMRHYTLCVCLVSVEYLRSTMEIRRLRLCDYFLVLLFL